MASKWAKPKTTPPDPISIDLPASLNGSTAWYRAALTRWCDRVASMPESGDHEYQGRNDALNKAWTYMGSIGHTIPRDTARTALRNAALASGLDAGEVDSVLRDGPGNGWDAGAATPRYPSRPDLTPDITEVTHTDAAPAHENHTAEPASPTRRLDLTPASRIHPRRVRWLWKNRLALGTIGLLAGREGLGKSTLAYWIAAKITQGDLYGEHHGQPRGILVCATEDSWEHTIVPRLIAAGADLDRVFRVEVVDELGVHSALSLPRDLPATEQAAAKVNASLLLLDPLMSRLGTLDTHRDAEVRQALEPLAALADRADMAILGLIHHNKTGSTDPLQLVMGSKAFTAVARSVHTVIPDPDDQTNARRLFGTPKNNLGATNLPTFSFTIDSYAVPTDDGDARTGRLVWGEEVAEAIGEAMTRAATPADELTEVSECADWLHSWMDEAGGELPGDEIRKEASRRGFSKNTVYRARQRLQITSARSGQGKAHRSMWRMPYAVVNVEEAPQ